MTTTILHESSSAVRASDKGTYKIVLITPGRGSSGYYSEEMLRAYGPDAFPAGSHSYIDHIKEGETRSPQKMIGVYTEAARYEDGVGLVAELKPFSHWKQFVAEVAPHSGFSIFAGGTVEEGMIDGETVNIVKTLTPSVTNSVDLVSYAGRGGHLAEQLLQEALNSTHTESSAGADKKDKETMAEKLEERLDAVLPKFEAFLAAEEAKAVKAAEAEDEADKVAEAIKSAVAATRAVAEAKVSDKLRARLYAQVEEGNFEVEAAIAEAEELRAEVEESLRESLNLPKGSFASDGKDSGFDFNVGRW